jgi:methyl-accepting chemotaxis protein
MAKRGFFKGLQGKLLGLFLLLSLVPLIVVSVISFQSSKRGLQTMARETLVHTAEGIRRTVEIMINDRQDDVKSWAGSPAVAHAFEKKEYRELSSLLAGLQKNYDGYKVIMAFDPAGNLVAASDGEMLHDAAVEKNQSSHRWFQAAVKGEVDVDDVYHSETIKEDVMAFSAPVKDAGGRVIGVVTSRLPWSEVQRVVEEVKFGETGYAYILNKDGVIIAHPKRNKVLKENLLKDQKSPEMVQLVGKMVKGQSGTGEYDYEGLSKLVAYVPSKGYGDYKGLGWSYAVVQGSDEILAPATLLRNVVIVLVLISIVVVSLLAIVIARGMARPLLNGVAFAQAVAAGDLTGRLEVKNDDEVGDLARALNAMAAGLKDLVARILESSGEVASAAGEISANTAQLTKAAQGQASAAEETSATMVQMAASIDTVASSAGSLAANAEQVSSSVEELGSSSEQVAKSAEVMASSVSETSATIEQMAVSIENVARNADELVTSVTETSATIEEMTVAIDQVAVNSQELQKVVGETSSAIEQMAASVREVARKVEEADAVAKGASGEGAAGLEASREAVAAMARVAEVIDRTSASIVNLGKRSEEIGNIVNVINEIADQTNLLALNAAIEAARAGDAGRGFAVVADEVRKLAERSVGATKEIAQVIRQVQEDTGESVRYGEIASKEAKSSMELSAAAGGSIEKIVGSIERTSALMSDVAQMTAEQSGASRQVIHAVERMSQAADVVANAAREQAAGGRQIRVAVERMTHITQEVTGATKEQALGSRQIRVAVENMNQVTGQVTVATKEQSVSARQIAAAVTGMSSMTQSVALAASEQKRGGEMVVVAIDNISDGTRENLSAVEQLLRAAQGLSEQASGLSSVAGAFRVS